MPKAYANRLCFLSERRVAVGFSIGSGVAAYLARHKSDGIGTIGFGAEAGRFIRRASVDVTRNSAFYASAFAAVQLASAMGSKTMRRERSCGWATAQPQLRLTSLGQLAIDSSVGSLRV